MNLVVKDLKLLAHITTNSRRDQQTKSIEFMQTCVKTKMGVGDTIRYHFFAPLNTASEDTVRETINFDSKHLGEDFDLLKRKADEQYIHKQCLKMANYLQKVRKVEILQMKTEFLKD